MGKDVQPLQSVKTSILAELTVRSGVGDIYIKDDDSCVLICSLLLFNALHYLCHIDHEIVRAIQSSCYTCGVRHGLTLAISPHPQEKFWACDQQSVGSCRMELIPEVGVFYPLFVNKGYLFYTKYIMYLCIVF